MIERPYSDVSDGNFIGLSRFYLDLLAESDGLRDAFGAEFNCSTLVEFDLDGFEGFTGLAEYFEECVVDGSSAACKYDLAVSGFARSGNRVGKVDFVTPFAFDSLSVVQRRQYIGAGKVFFLAPFSWSVWAGIALIVVLQIFVTLLDRNFIPSGESDAPPPGTWGLARIKHTLLRTHRLRRLPRAFFQTAFNMMLAVLTGLFLVLSYESALVLHVFRDEPISKFRSIDDVKNCRIPGSDICFVAGGVEEDFWNSAVATARSNCRTAAEDESPFHVQKGVFDDPFSAGLDAVVSGKCKFFLAATSTISIASKSSFCGDLSIVGEKFYKMSIGYILPKDSPLTEPLSMETLQLQQDGLLKTPSEYGEEAFPSTCGIQSSQRIGWGQLGLFFYVVTSAQCLMLVCLLLERPEVTAREQSPNWQAK